MSKECRIGSYTEVQSKQDVDTLVSVLNNFGSGNDISISLIQRKCKCGYNSAYRVFEKLAKKGRIIRSETHPLGISKML